MFSTPRNNVVESDEGFYVEVLGRTGLKYVEGSRAVFIDSEVLMGPHGMAIDKKSIKNWQIPSGDIDSPEKDKLIRDVHEVTLVGDSFLFEGFTLEEAIDDNTRDEIIENVRKAFLFQGFEIEID